MCARCSWSQVSAFQHYCNIPLASSLSQSLYSSPKPYPPLSVLIRRPSSPPCYHMPRLPPPPFPPSSRPVDGHACLKAMCFYWLWDGPLFISVVTDKAVSWDWGGCSIICTILAVATATAEIHIYFAFYWDILMLSEALQTGHVNSSVPIRRGVTCFTVSKLQRGSYSFNHSPPLHCLLNKCSGAETSQRDCKAWPCNCLDHFHHKMAGLASHRRFKNIFGCKLLMKRGFYLKSGTDLHCDITHL